MVNQQEVNRLREKYDVACREYLEARRKGKRQDIVEKLQDYMILAQAESDHAEYIFQK